MLHSFCFCFWLDSLLLFSICQKQTGSPRLPRLFVSVCAQLLLFPFPWIWQYVCKCLVLIPTAFTKLICTAGCGGSDCEADFISISVQNQQRTEKVAELWMWDWTWSCRDAEGRCGAGRLVSYQPTTSSAARLWTLPTLAGRGYRCCSDCCWARLSSLNPSEDPGRVSSVCGDQVFLAVLMNLCVGGTLYRARWTPVESETSSLSAAQTPSISLFLSLQTFVFPIYEYFYWLFLQPVCSCTAPSGSSYTKAEK